MRRKFETGLKLQGWKSNLSKEDIEDAIENTKDQIEVHR